MTRRRLDLDIRRMGRLYQYLSKLTFVEFVTAGGLMHPGGLIGRNKKAYGLIDGVVVRFGRFVKIIKDFVCFGLFWILSGLADFGTATNLLV